MTDLIPASQALGNAIRLRRERELNLSRDAFAMRLGWTPQHDGTRTRSGWSPRTVVRVEQGDRGLRDRDEINRLAAALELTPGELEGRISSPAPTQTGDPYGFAAAIDDVADPDARAMLLRIAGDLSDLARRLADDRPPGGD